MEGGRLPRFLDLAGRSVLVVGGGAVATRRTRRAVDAGAVVTVVSPQVSDDLAALAHSVQHRAFAPADVDGAWLVLACTDDEGVNAAVADAADAAGVWCVRSDDAEASAAWLPAAGHADGITIAVSAGGDPARAAAVRDHAVRALETGEWHARR